MAERKPGYRAAYNINPAIVASNDLDTNENPTGGFVRLITEKDGADAFMAMLINWQDGPRGIEQTADHPAGIAPPNGAFVEDVIWAAIQRLEFFNESKYRCRENSLAITKLEEALFILKDRQLSRSDRGVEGKHEV